MTMTMTTRNGRGDAEDRCARRRCRGEAALIYYGNPICARCWGKLCALDGERAGAGKRWWFDGLAEEAKRIHERIRDL